MRQKGSRTSLLMISSMGLDMTFLRLATSSTTIDVPGRATRLGFGSVMKSMGRSVNSGCGVVVWCDVVVGGGWWVWSGHDCVVCGGRVKRGEDGEIRYIKR